MKTKISAKEMTVNILTALIAGIIVGFAYHVFQNANGFAPGGVGGLATICYHYFGGNWTVLMLAFNLPIMILVSIFINKILGFMLILYMTVQSCMPYLLNFLNMPQYCEAVSGSDYNQIFAAIVTGVISGFGFSLMLKRFGASGGTYGISALLKKARPDMNIAYVSFIMDASVVFIAFFVYGMQISPVVCTLMNLFIAALIVDNMLSGVKDGYKFEIITSEPEKISEELMTSLKHGVTEIRAHGMYSDTDKYMLVCIINKRQVGQMMKIIKKYPGTFASFQRVNEVFGNFKRKV